MLVDLKHHAWNFVKQWYIVLFLIIIYIPMIIIVLISLGGQTTRGNINYGIGGEWTLGNYVALFGEANFLNALGDSLILGIIVTPVSVIIATITCFGIWRTTTIQKQSVLLTSNAAISTPDAITGISLLLLFSATIVPLGIDMGLFTVILAHISFCVPYAILAIYPKMSKLNVNLIWASYDLGAGKLRTFFKVVVPFVLPGIIAGAIISFAMSIDDYVITNLVNGSFQTIGTEIYSARKGIKAWIVTFGAIMVIITFVIVIIKVAHGVIKSQNNNIKKIAKRIGKN